MFWLQIRSDFGKFYDLSQVDLAYVSPWWSFCLKLSKMLELTADNAEGAHGWAVWAGGGGQTHKGHTLAEQSSGPIPRLGILLEVLRLAN